MFSYFQFDLAPLTELHLKNIFFCTNYSTMLSISKFCSIKHFMKGRDVYSIWLAYVANI